MAQTTSTEVASDIIDYQQERLLAGLHNQLVADQLAQKGTIPANKGETIVFHKKIKLARPSSSLTEGTDITPGKMYMASVNATAEEEGGGIELTRVVHLTAKHLALWDEMVDSISTQSAERLDYIMTSILAGGAYRMRADNDATYQVDVTATSDGSTTTFISTSLTQVDDFFNGGYISITFPETTTYLDRDNYCETRKISDFVASTDTVTHAAFPAITKSGCTAHLCVGTGITATDVLSTDVYALAMRQLKRHKGVRFDDALVKKGTPSHKETENLPPGSGGPGYWGVILDTDTEYDFMKDTTWTEVGKQQDKSMLVKGEIGKWMGSRAYGTTQPWLEDVDGTENESSGAVHPAHFLARDAYCISDIAAPGAKAPWGVLLELMTSKDLAQKVPRSVTASWLAYFARRSLNSLWNVAMLTGATA